MRVFTPFIALAALFDKFVRGLVCFPPPSSSVTLSNVAVTLAHSYGLGVIVTAPVTFARTAAC